MDKGSAGFFWCVFAIIMCVNLPFIVCDLVFGSQENDCVTTPGNSIGFDLGTWL